MIMWGANFWSKVDTEKFGMGCWEWTAAKTDGYGRFWDGEQTIYAHRYAFERINGPILEGLELDHLCRNRSCVNPSHLEVVTHEENVRRGLSGKVNNHNTQKTHCKNGHPLTEDNLSRGHLRVGQRCCRICFNQKMSETMSVRRHSGA